VGRRIEDRAARDRARPAGDTRADLAALFAGVRRRTEELCAPLSGEDCQAQSMPDASPAKWHLAHTTWFFETFVLAPGRSDYRVFHPDFRVLFNSYYQSVGPQHPRPARGLLTRPSLDEVRAYRRHVDGHLLDLLEAGIDPDRAAVVRLGVEHEQQHQELILTDVKHLLWCNPLRPAYRAQAPRTVENRSPAQRWLRHEGGESRIGYDGTGFSFDNERPRHRVLVPAFEIASRSVTSGEFLDFIEDGGYRRPDLWLSDGWNAVRLQLWEAPLYWERRGDEWAEFTLSGMRDLRREAAVCHVSFYEADAYARWAKARLPTEAEWEIAAADSPVHGNFADRGLFHPSAAPPGGRLAQIFGDVWEWTSSAYAPYPGYRPPAGALGEYNGKFMCNQLVLRGGSCATPRDHLRASYRNFFYPHQRWMYSGLRLAKDA
jgi:ergothioneine biosynthesis protein EgtB